MIFNKYGRVVVPVGETFEYAGAEYRCEVTKRAGLTNSPCNRCALVPFHYPCMALSCCPDGRVDEEFVVFVKQEGGEDERK